MLSPPVLCFIKLQNSELNVMVLNKPVNFFFFFIDLRAPPEDSCAGKWLFGQIWITLVGSRSSLVLQIDCIFYHRHIPHSFLK